MRQKRKVKFFENRCLNCNKTFQASSLKVKYCNCECRGKSKTEIYEKNFLEKYGVKNPSQVKNIKQKTAATCLKKYGVNHNFKIPEVKEQIKITCLKKYGVNHNFKIPEVVSHVYETKKKNNSFNTSKLEEKLYLKLIEKFGADDVERQHCDIIRYPFNCDFYISSLDLFIEFQGSWTHGRCAFDIDDVNCQEKLKIWKEKSKTSKFYKNAIEAWTVRDVKKRKVAKEHELHYLEVFNSNTYLEEVLSHFREEFPEPMLNIT